MNCDKFEQRMHYLLDRRRRPELDAQLTAHAQSCLDCRSTLAVQESLLDSLEMLETPEMSDDFNQRVLASVASATPAKSNGRSHRRLFRGLAALAAVAAVLMVALIPLLSREGTSQKDGGAHTTLDPTRPPALPGPTKDNVIATTNRSGANTRQKKDPVDGKTAAEENQLALGELLLELADQIPPDALERFDTVQQLSNGIRPVASSFTEAASLLRSTLPNLKREKPIPPRASGYFFARFKLTIC